MLGEYYMQYHRNTHRMRLARFPANQKEYVTVITPFEKSDQKDEGVPNNFNLHANKVKRQNLLVDEDDGLLGKGMRLAG
jgi:hypothetical protein